MSIIRAFILYGNGFIFVVYNCPAGRPQGETSVQRITPFNISSKGYKIYHRVLQVQRSPMANVTTDEPNLRRNSGIVRDTVLSPCPGIGYLIINPGDVKYKFLTFQTE
jgi:hypothetical protein